MFDNKILKLNLLFLKKDFPGKMILPLSQMPHTSFIFHCWEVSRYNYHPCNNFLFWANFRLKKKIIKVQITPDTLHLHLHNVTIVHWSKLICKWMSVQYTILLTKWPLLFGSYQSSQQCPFIFSSRIQSRAPCCFCLSCLLVSSVFPCLSQP